MNKDAHHHFWEKIGTDDPYFGVMSHEKYRGKGLDESAHKDFFETGEKHVTNVLKVFEKIRTQSPLETKNALDFGCGTGRISIPLSRRFEFVRGVDISSSMLLEAEKNSQFWNRSNIQFEQIDGKAPFLDQQFDYIHSSMVFQHIPPQQGMDILSYLLDHLKQNGKFFFQVTFHTEGKAQKPKRKRFFNAKRPDKDPSDYRFSMFDYDLNEIYKLFMEKNVRKIYSVLGQTGRHQFVRFYLQK